MDGLGMDGVGMGIKIVTRSREVGKEGECLDCKTGSGDGTGME